MVYLVFFVLFFTSTITTDQFNYYPASIESLKNVYKRMKSFIDETKPDYVLISSVCLNNGLGKATQ